jgi:hypothetical protein
MCDGNIVISTEAAVGPNNLVRLISDDHSYRSKAIKITRAFSSHFKTPFPLSNLLDRPLQPIRRTGPL